MLAGFPWHRLQQEIAERTPGVVIGLRDFVVAHDVAGFLNVEGSGVRPINAGDQLEPCFRFQDVIEPQAPTLVISERLA